MKTAIEDRRSPMNREIFFRGKRIDNGEWIYGDLLCNWTEPQILSEEDGNEYEVIPETVGQFTGLLDKNGNKVFEGDILIHKDTNPLKLVAKYVTDNMYSSCLRLCYLSDNKEYRQAAGKFYEIIGTIHDTHLTQQS